MGITFTLGASTFTSSQNPEYPLSQPIEKIQSVDRTASGLIRTEDYEITIKRFPLSWSSMPKTDYDNLRNWFDQIANGSANQFVYTDIDGLDHDVFISDKIFDFPRVDTNQYSGTINLEEV